MPKKSKKPSTSKPTQTKADFVRSLPADIPAKEVVAKASEAKVALTEDYVYKTRSLDNKAKGKKAAPAAAKKTEKPAEKSEAAAPAVKAAAASKTARTGKTSKKAVVLDLVAKNPGWTAEQVAKSAKCSAAYVYSVWKKKPKAAAAAAPKSKPASAPTASHGSVGEFYRVLKRVGVVKARELIANIEAYENA